MSSHDDDAPEIAAVTVSLLGVEHVRKSGSLLAFVCFKCAIGGVEIIVQGAQVRRRGRGDIQLTEPQFRSGTGVWLPAVIMPETVMLSVLELLGTEWPPRDASRLPEMRMHPPELTLSFAPRVEHKR